MNQSAIDFSSVRRILVAKLRHHGDVLLTSPVFSNLKRVCPEAQIDAYIYRDTLPMLEGHPDIDGFALYDKGWKKLGKVRRYLEELKLLRKIRRAGYDLVINLTEGDRAAIAAWVSGARYRVAFDPKGQGMWGKERCYTHMVRECPMIRHTVEMNLDVLRGVGIFPGSSDRELHLHLPEAAKERVANLVSGPYVVVHPVSRWMFKCAPEEVIAAGIDHLSRQGFQVVLTAAPDPHEMAYNERVSALATAEVLDLSGQISLKELGALIDEAAMLFCVDSVPMHMSSALKTPVVAIFGPTSDVRWAPWQNPNAQVVAQEMSCRPCYRPGCVDSGVSDCLTTIKEESVIAAIDQVLERISVLV